MSAPVTARAISFLRRRRLHSSFAFPKVGCTSTKTFCHCSTSGATCVAAVVACVRFCVRMGVRLHERTDGKQLKLSRRYWYLSGRETKEGFGEGTVSGREGEGFW